MYKISQIFKLQFKCIRRSLFLPILLILPLSVLLLRYNSTIDKSGGWLSVWASTTTYGYMIAALCCITLGIYISFRDGEIIYSLDIGEKRIVIGKVCCLLLFSFMIILEPLGIIIFHFVKLKNPSLDILFNIITNIFITWGTGLTFASVLGFSIGYFFKNKLTYIFAILAMFVISPYNRIFITNNSAVNTMYSLINIDLNNIDIPFDIFRQNDFNLFWLYDKLFLLLLIAGLITLCIYKENIYKSKNRVKRFIYCCTFFIVGFFLFSRAEQYYPRTYLKPNLSKEFTVNDMVIENYAMNIKLANKLNNICTIEMSNKSNHDITMIKLCLDKAFNIKNINCEGNNLQYTRDMDIVNITFNKCIEPKQKIKITIDYNGYVNYITSMRFDKYFANANSTFLPSDDFIWYPINGLDNYKHFTISIISNNQVYSNLQQSIPGKKSDNEYFLEGDKKNIFLISGFLKEKNVDGNDIIGPEDYLGNDSIKVGLVIKFIKERIDPIADPSLKFTKAVEERDRPIYFVPLVESKVPYLICDDCIFISSYILTE